MMKQCCMNVLVSKNEVKQQEKKRRREIRRNEKKNTMEHEAKGETECIKCRSANW